MPQDKRGGGLNPGLSGFTAGLTAGRAHRNASDLPEPCQLDSDAFEATLRTLRRRTKPPMGHTDPVGSTSRP